MTITYEAEQERPARYCTNRISKVFPTLLEAERYARRILGERPGQPVTIWRKPGINGSGSLAQDRVAIVSRDALDRTWTDLVTMEPLL